MRLDWQSDTAPPTPGGSLNTTANRYFIHTDHLGTPQALTDDSQTVVWQADYQPFGEAQVDEDPDGDGQSVEMPLRFPGQYADRESGLYYNYFRDYDPSLGRYLQSDPIGLRGGLNTYGYVFQNPLSYIDPLGLEVTMNCRPLKGVLGSLGFKHCSVFVWHWETDECGREKKVIDAQYSLSFGNDSMSGPNDPTYQSDTEAFKSDDGNHDIPIPIPLSQTGFDQAVMNSGDGYTQGPYNPILGPNSNTAADNIIENAGGVAPNVPGAVAQNYGDRPTSGQMGRSRRRD